MCFKSIAVSLGQIVAFAQLGCRKARYHRRLSPFGARPGHVRMPRWVLEVWNPISKEESNHKTYKSQ